MATYKPWIGEQNTRSWNAALSILESGPAKFADVRQAMMRAGDIKSPTAANILREAKRAGAITVRGEYNQKLHQDPRVVSLVESPESALGRSWLQRPGSLVSAATPSGSAGGSEASTTTLGLREGLKEGHPRSRLKGGCQANVARRGEHSGTPREFDVILPDGKVLQGTLCEAHAKQAEENGRTVIPIEE